jgi:methanogenic corrinoid protein MtbC1
VPTVSNASHLFEEFFDRLLAVVRERLSIRLRYQHLPDLDKLNPELQDSLTQFGLLLRTVYRYNLWSGLFEEAIWYASLFDSRGLGPEAFTLLLECWIIAIQGLIQPPECNELSQPLEELRTQVPQMFAQVAQRRQPRPEAEINTLVDLLMQADFPAGLHLLKGKIATGTPPGLLLTGLLLGAMQEVGRRWEADVIAIFQEHLATETIQRLLASLYFLAPPSVKLPYSALVSGVPGEEHQLLVAALSIYLELQGWRTLPLGRSLPTAELVQAAEALKPQVCFLSLTMLARVPEALEVVGALRARQPGWPIIVGGRGAILARRLFETEEVSVLQDFAAAHSLALEKVSHA